MELKTIVQEPIFGSDDVVTTAVVTHVASPCILARQLMDVLGKPPIHSDLEILGSDDTWTIFWSQPPLTLAEATAAINQALSPTTQEK